MDIRLKGSVAPLLVVEVVLVYVVLVSTCSLVSTYYVVLVYYVDFVVLVVVLLFCVPVVLIVSDVRDGRLAPACYRALLVDCTPPTQDGDRLLWHWGA